MNLYERAARILASSKNVVAFTGAGISAESGVPTFRDPGGLWDQFDPAEFGTVEGMLGVVQKKPELIRQFLLQTVVIFEQSRPNPGHYGLCELEKHGVLKTVITQNIDNLHTDAGSKNVLEVHGNLFRARCTRCGRRYQLDKQELLKKTRELLEDAEGFGIDKLLTILPPCECGGLTRPDVVMFGEAVQQLNQSFAAAGSTDALLVLGTSGVVYPAAAVPHQAHQSGAKIIVINPTENAYSAITEVYIKEPSGEAMPKVMDYFMELVS